MNLNKMKKECHGEPRKYQDPRPRSPREIEHRENLRAEADLVRYKIIGQLIKEGVLKKEEATQLLASAFKRDAKRKVRSF